MMTSDRNTLFIAWLIYLSMSVRKGDCELYTSADELSKWSQVTSNISAFIQEMIEDHEMRLKHLREIQSSINPIVKLTNSDLAPAQHDHLMENPVNAFVVIHRLRRAVERAEDLFLGDKYIHSEEQIDDDSEDSSRPVARDYLQRFKSELPFEEDLLGSAKALLRLQSFYGLKISELMVGIILRNSSVELSGARNELGALQMNVEDCLELGKIAFREDLFGLAIQWLSTALELIYDEQVNRCQRQEFDSMINEILDYMAFAAYKLDMVAYSANLTRTWLEREPDNERARENLDFYLDLLAGGGEERERERERELSPDPDPEPINEAEPSGAGQDVSSYPYLRNGIEDYSLADDQIVRHLCRNLEQLPSAKSSSLALSCERSGPLLTPQGHFCPGLKIELLNGEPRVLRLYDIITQREADHLRAAARPLLERSTVSSGEGLKTSDFRIAKTAWLSGASDELVRRVERRLGAALNLNMDSSEQLQVVNYGLGGFYGPHLDSARKRQADDQSVMLGELHQNDRLATLLVYLSHVDAGGATVFPRLNLTVAPIERSAVAWFNILPSGHSDERTLHTGCPVLLGSKWIATKWPRERANAFTRPCTTRDAPGARGEKLAPEL